MIDNKLNIVIIYSDKTYFNKIAQNINSIENACILASSNNISNILLLCNEFIPDLLIYEIYPEQHKNPGPDYIKKIHSIRNSKIYVLATSSNNNAASNISYALDSGADIYMSNLDDINILRSVLQVIRSKNLTNKGEDVLRMEVSKKVSDLLFKMNLPTHFTGYHFLKSCILNTIFRDSKLPESTSIMYAKISDEYSVTPKQVSRAIYKAVSHINKFNEKRFILNAILGYDIESLNYEINAKELVTLIADQLRIRYSIC